MFSLSSVRSVRTRIAPRLIKQVLARAFTDDHLLQEQYYGSKLEHLYLGRSIQAIWSAMKEASSYPNPLLDQLTDAEISSGHDTDFAPKAFAFQLFVDLSNPLLSKYGFNHSEFSAGATFAIRDTVNAIQSPDFIEHCKGKMKKCPSSELLRNTLHPGLYLPFFFATRNKSPHMLTGYTVKSAHLRSISTKIQTAEGMMLQKMKSDGSMKFDHDISYDEFLYKSKRIEQEHRRFLWNCKILLNPQMPIIVEMYRTYLESGNRIDPNVKGKGGMEDFIEFVIGKISHFPNDEKDTSSHVESYRISLREMIRITVINMNAEASGVKPAIESFYDIEEEKKKYYGEKKSSDSTIKSNSNNCNIDQSENNVRIFSPILPYPVGGVIATADVIFKCSRKSDETEHLFRWQFESCISSEKYDWLSTDLVYLAPSATTDQ